MHPAVAVQLEELGIRAAMLSQAIVGVALGAAFGFLAVLHVFWAFGGTWGAGAAVAEIDGAGRDSRRRAAPRWLWPLL
jgi:hypothetical protein